MVEKRERAPLYLGKHAACQKKGGLGFKEVAAWSIAVLAKHVWCDYPRRVSLA